MQFFKSITTNLGGTLGKTFTKVLRFFVVEPELGSTTRWRAFWHAMSNKRICYVMLCYGSIMDWSIHGLDPIGLDWVRDNEWPLLNW